MTTEKILIILLIVVIISVAILFTITVHKLREDISGMEDAYIYLRKSYEYALDMLDDVNSKYAKSLDERERLLNDMNVRTKKLELEIDKRDSEIAHMDAILNYAKNDAVATEEKDEKEKIEKEN